MSFSVKTEPDFYDDQQVPLVDGETMFPVKTEPQDFTGPFYTTDPFTFGEEGRLPPVASLRCTPVDVSDQQLTGDTSHIQLLDLDQVTTEQPFYPDNFDKQQSSVPTGCQDYGYDSHSPNSLIFGELVVQDAVESLLTTVRDEIERACAALHIPPAPTLWTADQTRSWATLILQKNGHPTHEASMFQLPGSRLCQLSQDDFRSLSPSFGELFYNQLEIWNNWCYYEQTSQFTTEMPMTTESSYSSGYPEMVSHPAPSVSPAPSSCSMDSLGSSSGSSTGFPAQHTQFDFLNTVLDSEPRPERKVRHSEHKQTIHLWQFLKELLVHAPSHGNCIKWLDREKGIFKIEDSSRVATLWGKRKNRPAMNYDKLSRSIRQYYKKGIIKKTEHSKRLVYQFCKPYL